MTEASGQRLYVGDCRAVMAELATASVDAVVTSPPYNVGLAYGAYKDNLKPALYLGMMGEVATALDRLVKPNGHLFLNMGVFPSKDPWLATDAAGVFRRVGWRLQNHFVWAKSVTVGEVTSGQFKPVPSHRFVNHMHEAIFHFTKTGDEPIDRLAIGVPYSDKRNVGRTGGGRDLRCGGDLWFMPYERVQSKGEKFHHPAAFPLELPLRCLKLTGRKGVVLDPFVGTGTTLVAGEQLGWSGIGIDIDPAYIDVAAGRIHGVQILDAKAC